MKKSSSFTLLISIFALLSLACESKHKDIREIALQIRKNQCEIDRISQYVDESWTKSIQELGNFLPERLPEQERQNILSLKNADLIRMFESYEEFDPEGHSLVDSMELLDEAWADSLRNLSMENQKLEMQIDSLLSLVDDNVKVDRISVEIEEIRSSSCD